MHVSAEEQATAAWIIFNRHFFVRVQNKFLYSDAFLQHKGIISMTPQDAEAEASDNCVLYWLSTRLDIQTVNLATASLPTHTCFTILLLFDCKIFSVISGGFVQVRCIASPHTFRTALLYGHRTTPM